MKQEYPKKPMLSDTHTITSPSRLGSNQGYIGKKESSYSCSSWPPHCFM